MKIFKWLNLQLFAGEGAGASGGEGGGDGAATGATEGLAAEDQRLLELGVPKEKLQKRAKRASANLPSGAVRTASNMAQEQAQQQSAPAENNTPATEEKTEQNTPKRMTWDEIVADPEYNEHMQSMMKNRLRSAKAAEEAMGKLTPALEVLARQYGLDITDIDYDALNKKISEEDQYYEDLALEWGCSLEEARKRDQKERADSRQKRMEDKSMQEQMFQQHFQRLETEAKELQKQFPGFNLQEELKNPTFARMTAPGTGIMSVEDAYHAVHRKELQATAMQMTARSAVQKVTNDIASGNRRPAENGTSGQAPSVTSFDYRNASREQREALKREIRSAAARGEKLYPGR
jgi:hypothetical protein